MLSRLSAFVIWSLVAATLMFWLLRFTASPPRAPAYAVPVDRSAPARGDLARLFGAAPVVATSESRPEASSRFRLLGVMAPKGNSHAESTDYGFALIAVDGKPAKAFGIGARLENGLVLQSVGLRTASLGPAQGERSMLLELPTLPARATGVLPPPGATAAAATRIVPTRPAAPMPAPAMPMIGSPVPPIPQSPAVPAADPPPVPGLPSPEDARTQ